MNYRHHRTITCIALIIAVIGTWFSTTADTSIKSINSFNEVNFDAIETDMLVLFDVDETLIQPTDVYMVNEHGKHAKDLRMRLQSQHPEITDWSEFIGISLIQPERPLTEPTIIEKIAKLQARGVNVVACTAMNTGKYPMVETLQDWRYHHLSSLGFHGSFANRIFDLPTEAHNPVFYKGILVTDLQLKGPIVIKFLETMHLKPKKIIFFDDNMEQLKSVQKSCTEHIIAFQGYHYNGAIEKPWDEALIQFQAEYLIEHKQWLSDDKAYALMKAQEQPAY